MEAQPALEEEHWLVVHELRLRGLAQLPESRAVAHVVEIGYALRKQAHYALTPAGRDAHAKWSRYGPGSPEREAAQRAYGAFGPLNVELLQVCSAWQVHARGVPNDHNDAEYDWSVIDRLALLDERAGPLVRRLGKVAVRFGDYGPRLRHALDRVKGGEHAWFTSPRIDSYHTVWMQFHEDLLLALGLDRSDELRGGEAS
jgi:pyruvate,orthophosphate dikinase